MLMLIGLALLALDPADRPQPSSRSLAEAPRTASASTFGAGLGAAPAPAPAPAPIPAPTTGPVRRPVSEGDGTVRRAQAVPAEIQAMPVPGLPPAGGPAGVPEPAFGGNSISLQAALMGAVTGNPDLVTLRNSNIASPEAVEVARRFPTTLNPTIWVDIRPIVLIPPDPFPSTNKGGPPTRRTGPFYRHGTVYYYLSYRQPVELGHQTRYRHHIAKAALAQQQWNVMQAELTTVVQTYRFFQTAAYRREKLRLADELADFNDRLLQALRRGFEANQVAAADVTLAEVENQATRQQVEVAMQDYNTALTDLRNQMGVPATAGTAEPLGEFILPRNIPEIDDQQLVQVALQNRPDLHAARAVVDGALAAVRLAKGDRIPTPIVGPEYQMDEVGVQYIGFVYITPLPVVNSGKALVIQREAEYCRTKAALQAAEQRAVTQVRAAAAKWNGATRLISQTGGLNERLKKQVASLERLFDQNQASLPQLLQARQRLIQLENAEIDAIWQATQAQADLLLALGAPSLIAALHQEEIRALPNPGPNSPAPTGATAPVPATAAVPGPPPAPR